MHALVRAKSRWQTTYSYRGFGDLGFRVLGIVGLGFWGLGFRVYFPIFLHLLLDL